MNDSVDHQIADAQDSVRAPALALVLSGIYNLISLLFLTLMPFLGVVGITAHHFSGGGRLPPNERGIWMGLGMFVVVILGGMLLLALSSLVITYGGLCLSRLQHYRWVMAGALWALILPCVAFFPMMMYLSICAGLVLAPNVVVGLVVCMWCFSVTTKTPVERAFQKVAEKGLML